MGALSQDAVVSVAVDPKRWDEGTARSVVGEVLEELEGGEGPFTHSHAPAGTRSSKVR